MLDESGAELDSPELKAHAVRCLEPLTTPPPRKAVPEEVESVRDDPYFSAEKLAEPAAEAQEPLQPKALELFLHEGSPEPDAQPWDRPGYAQQEHDGDDEDCPTSVDPYSFAAPSMHFKYPPPVCKLRSSAPCRRNPKRNLRQKLPRLVLSRATLNQGDADVMMPASGV